MISRDTERKMSRGSGSGWKRAQTPAFTDLWGNEDKAHGLSGGLVLMLPKTLGTDFSREVFES